MFGPKELDMRIFIFFCLLILSACAVPQNTNNVKASEPVASSAADNTTELATNKTTGAKPGVVDFSCNTDSDCKIKDVGSCCGHYPACVNKDSATYPAEVKAQCEKEGMMSTCGFPSISSCTCTNNKCQGVAGDMIEEKVQ
jgi:hypothetical protein